MPRICVGMYSNEKTGTRTIDNTKHMSYLVRHTSNTKRRANITKEASHPQQPTAEERSGRTRCNNEKASRTGWEEWTMVVKREVLKESNGKRKFSTRSNFRFEGAPPVANARVR